MIHAKFRTCSLLGHTLLPKYIYVPFDSSRTPDLLNHEHIEVNHHANWIVKLDEYHINETL